MLSAIFYIGLLFPYVLKLRNLCFFQKLTVPYPAANNVVTGSSSSVECKFLDCDLTFLWVTHF